MDTSDYRREIDGIDKQIVELFTERMNISAKIAKCKKEQNLPILDRTREREKMASVIEQTPMELRDFTPRLYSLLMEISRTYQGRVLGTSSDLTNRVTRAIEETPRIFPEFASVACQGVEGANSQYACDKLFKNGNLSFFGTFEDVFSAIETGMCRYGVIPVENSTAGSVNSVYDLMMRHHFYIVRSIRVKIEHNLLVKPGTKFEDIREIYSHEQAISQCSAFLSTLKNVRVIPCANTAIAAKMVAESERGDIAALSSAQCIRYYGLKCLRESVQNTDNNYTRFICIAKEPEIYPGANRTSLMLTLPDEPGSLYRVLSRLYALGINLIKLESRPLPNREFEFMFYFDLDTPVYSESLLQVLTELSDTCGVFHYLGSYSEVF